MMCTSLIRPSLAPSPRRDRTRCWHNVRRITASLSIIIPFHDGRGQVADLIADVLRSSDGRIEVIAVDDGSRDGSGDPLRRLDDPRVTVVGHRENRGVAAARNTGARRATGRHLLFVDSDDRLPPGTIDAWLTVLGEHCRLGFGHAAALSTDGTGSWRETQDLGPAFNDVHGLFLAGTFAVRRDLFERVGGYDEALRFSENSELGMRLSDHVEDPGRDTVLLGRSVLLITPRPDRAREYAEAQYRSLVRILGRHAPRLARDPRLESDYRAVAGVSALRTGRTLEGRRQLWLAFRRRPSLRAAGRCVASLLPVPVRPWRPGGP